jgi:branched-chain amino acid transport system substrate-binding protein
VVKIGVLTDLSGTYSDLAGSGAVLATKMAIEDFIAKEKPDFKIEMVSADHQNKADIASNKAREWFEREGVDTATELVTTSVALAVMKVAKERPHRPDERPGLHPDHQRAVQRRHRPLHLRHLRAGQRHGQGRDQAGRQELVLPDRRLRLRPGPGKDASAVVTANGGKVLGSVRHPSPAPTSRPSCSRPRPPAPRSSAWPMPAPTPPTPSSRPPSSASPRPSRWPAC